MYAWAGDPGKFLSNSSSASSRYINAWKPFFLFRKNRGYEIPATAVTTKIQTIRLYSVIFLFHFLFNHSTIDSCTWMC